MIKKYFYILFVGFFIVSTAQNKNNSFITLDYFYGNIIEHSPELKPIIQSHPSGVLFAWNNKKVSNSDFNNFYNFPDFGVSFSYEDFKTNELGKTYAAYAHYNFYLTNRNSKNQIKLTSAFGLGYSTNHFDKISNPKNWAIGSKFSAAAYLKLNYSREYLFDKLGLNAGFILFHYSNASFKAPNLGINTLALNLGVNYNFDEPVIAPKREKINHPINQPIKYSTILRFGFNESLINGSGLYPFYTISLTAEKKLNYKSTLSTGTDIFLATFMKEYIDYENSINETPDNNPDWKRVGLFVGHELNMEKFSILTQVGYHVYAPKKYVSGVYERFGFRKKFNEHVFTDLSLKINLFRAEGLEFGLGYQF